MREDKNQRKIYSPLINDFKNQTKNLYKKLWIKKQDDLSGLFIPHVFNDYYKAGIRYFYIGQDTYNWTGLAKVYRLNENEYLKENNDWPNTIDSTLEWTNPYTFWNFVNKMQLAFNDEKYDSLNNLSVSQRLVLNQLGWGNLYSLEVFETIKKYGDEFYKSFDHAVYSDLLEKSKSISKLKNIIDAFDPDYLIILAWQYVEEWYFQDLDVQFIESESIPNLLSIYKIRNTNKKILWTYHPQSLCRKSQDLNDLIKKIRDRL